MWDTTFHSQDFSEELLQLHEEKLAELQEFYANNESLFGLITRRETILDQLYELEGAQFEQGAVVVVVVVVVVVLGFMLF